MYGLFNCNSLHKGVKISSDVNVEKLLSISHWWGKAESDYKVGCVGMQGKESLVHGSALRVMRLCRLLSFVHFYGTVVRCAWKVVQQFENEAQ